MPEPEDGTSTDVMILLERKEHLERFLKEIVQQLDVFIYTPLGKYINLQKSICPLVEKVSFLQRTIRKYLGKVNLNMVCLLLYYMDGVICYQQDDMFYGRL